MQKVKEFEIQQMINTTPPLAVGHGPKWKLTSSLALCSMWLKKAIVCSIHLRFFPFPRICDVQDLPTAIQEYELDGIHTFVTKSLIDVEGIIHPDTP